tara:strand:+ start:131 stop:472 length:342 start_codon:yes stop_codon:yes gene_type:complete
VRDLSVSGYGINHEDWILGMPLVLVAGNYPNALAPGSRLSVRLYTYRRIFVMVISKITPKDIPRERSDANGCALIELKTSGPCLINAVYIMELPAGERGDWASIRTALLFSAK